VCLRSGPDQTGGSMYRDQGAQSRSQLPVKKTGVPEALFLCLKNIVQRRGPPAAERQKGGLDDDVIEPDAGST